jgi:hypothetical protein
MIPGGGAGGGHGGVEMGNSLTQIPRRHWSPAPQSESLVQAGVGAGAGGGIGGGAGTGESLTQQPSWQTSPVGQSASQVHCGILLVGLSVTEGVVEHGVEVTIGESLTHTPFRH